MNTTSSKRAEVEPKADHIVEHVACPACGAAKGTRCRAVIDGNDTGWTHDARVYADMGVRGR